jgi:THO complex subunit 3
MASKYYQEMQDSFRNNNKSREIPAHSAKVHSVAWSCDGRRLASGSFDKTASVFVLDKDRLVSGWTWLEPSMVALMLSLNE